MLAEKDSYIGSDHQQLQVISQDKQKHLEYETKEKAIRDHNQLLEAEQRGIQLGKQEEMELEAKHINILNALLFQQKCYDDLERSVNNVNYQQQLLKEYDI